MKQKVILVPVAIAILAGCATLTDTRTATIQGYEEVRKAPMLPISRNVTPFTDGLRCMDDLFGQYGTNVSLMVEDLSDKTQKSAAGTTEMFLGALSEMTRRNHAVRTVAFGEDTKNLTSFITKSGTKEPFQLSNIPTYSVRGTVSQFDDNLAKKTIDMGISFGPFTSGGARSSSINMVALDLLVLRAHDYSLVPGVRASNIAAILQEGEGIDIDVIYKKFGVNFMTSLSKSDGKAIAIRNLVELGAIELMGKLNRVPYWKCLGVDSNHPDVLKEIDDWYEAMSTEDKGLFLRQQFDAFGLFPATVQLNPDIFRLAFRVYSEVLGFPDNKKISQEIFRAHFAADPKIVGPKVLALFEAEKKRRLAVELTLEPARSRDEASFSLKVNQPAVAYCFLQHDKTKQIRQILPYPSQRSNALPAGKPVLLRDIVGHAVASLSQGPQTLSCFATAQDRTKEVTEMFHARAGMAIRGITDFKAFKSQLGARGTQLADATISFGGERPQPTGEPARK